MSAGRLMRLQGMMRKEWLQVIRDPSSIAIAFFLPILLLVIFGYGVSLDAKDVRIGIVMEQRDQPALSFVGGFEQTPYFQPSHFASIQEAETALRAAEIDGIVWLRHDFGSQYLKDQSPPIGLIVQWCRRQHRPPDPGLCPRNLGSLAGATGRVARLGAQASGTTGTAYMVQP